MGELLLTMLYWTTYTCLSTKIFFVWLWVLRHTTSIFFRSVITLSTMLEWIVVIVIYYVYYDVVKRNYKQIKDKERYLESLKDDAYYMNYFKEDK